VTWARLNPLPSCHARQPDPLGLRLPSPSVGSARVVLLPATTARLLDDYWGRALRRARGHPPGRSIPDLWPYFAPASTCSNVWMHDSDLLAARLGSAPRTRPCARRVLLLLCSPPRAPDPRGGPGHRRGPCCNGTCPLRGEAVVVVQRQFCKTRSAAAHCSSLSSCGQPVRSALALRAGRAASSSRSTAAVAIASAWVSFPPPACFWKTSPGRRSGAPIPIFVWAAVPALRSALPGVCRLRPNRPGDARGRAFLARRLTVALLCPSPAYRPARCRRNGRATAIASPPHPEM